MPLGRCMTCDCLKTIVAREFYPKSKQRRWYPILHEAPYYHLVDGKDPCGPLRKDEDVPDTFECEACQARVDYSGVRGGGVCDGHKREIK